MWLHLSRRVVRSSLDESFQIFGAGGADIIRHGQNGYLISNIDAVDEMRQCIDDHLSLKPDCRKKLSQACWETARQMTIDRNVEQTLSLFREVVDEKL